MFFGKDGLRKRADKEMKIVKSCEEYYRDSIKAVDLKIKDDQDEIASLMEKIRIASTKDQQVELAIKVQDFKRILSNHLKQKDQYIKLESMLRQLYNSLEIFYDNGKYKLIVVKIPEKKLPKLVRDVNKVGELFELIKKLVKQYNDEVIKLRKLYEDANKNLDDLEKSFNATQTILDDKYGSTEDSVADIINMSKAGASSVADLTSSLPTIEDIEVEKQIALNRLNRK